MGKSELEKQIFTVGRETDHRALCPLSVRLVETCVATLILDGNRLDRKLTVWQRSREPDSPLISWLDHGVAPFCKRGHLCWFALSRRVFPQYLLHLFGQTKGAWQGRPLAAHCCFVSLRCDFGWEWKTKDQLRAEKIINITGRHGVHKGQC